MTSCTPRPFIEGYKPPEVRFNSPLEGPKAGKRFGTTRTFQPGLSGWDFVGRYAMTSGGVIDSLPAQNGHRAAPVVGSAGARVNELGRLARSVAIATQRPVTMS